MSHTKKPDKPPQREPFRESVDHTPRNHEKEKRDDTVQRLDPPPPPPKRGGTDNGNST